RGRETRQRGGEGEKRGGGRRGGFSGEGGGGGGGAERYLNRRKSRRGGRKFPTACRGIPGRAIRAGGWRRPGPPWCRRAPSSAAAPGRRPQHRGGGRTARN